MCRLRLYISERLCKLTETKRIKRTFNLPPCLLRVRYSLKKDTNTHSQMNDSKVYGNSLARNAKLLNLLDYPQSADA